MKTTTETPDTAAARGDRRRRPHRAPATRILAAGLSTSATVALVSTMAAAAGPDAATPTQASPWPVSYVEDELASPNAPPAQKVIRIEIHRKVYVPVSAAAGTGTRRTGVDRPSSGGGTQQPSPVPSRTSRSRAS